MSKSDSDHNLVIEQAISMALNKINFYARYHSLSLQYRTDKPRFEDFAPEHVTSIIKVLGYDSKYNHKEKFFGIVEVIDDFRITFNISLKYGIVELIWGLRLKDQKTAFGGPWGYLCSSLKNHENPIKKPFFSSYDDLRAILEDAFEVYEDFKSEIRAQLMGI